MVERNTTLDGNLKLRLDRQTISVMLNPKIAQTYENYPQVLDENMLNTWADLSQVQNNQAAYTTELRSDQFTLADWKLHLLNMSANGDEFRDQYRNLIIEVLRLLLYVEQGKEWQFPIDPLNIIYDQSANQCKVFYREAHQLRKVDQEWMNNVSKLVVYLAIPEVDNSTNDYCVSDFSGLYSQYLYGGDAPTSDDLTQLIREYGQDLISDLGTQAYDIIAGTDGNGEPSSVEDMLYGLNAGDIVNDVTNDKSYIDTTRKPVNNHKSNIQFDEQERQQPRKAVKKQGSGLKTLLFVLIFASIVGGGIYWFMTKDKQPQQMTNNTNTEQKSAKPQSSKDFYNGLLASSSLDYGKASDDFDKYFSNGGSKDNLSAEETGAVFSSYLNSGRYNEILQNIGSDKTANALIKYLVSKNDETSIKKLNSTKYPIVKFAQDDLKHDYRSMTSAADTVDLSDNTKFQDDMCNAFAQTNELEKGKKWANSQTNSKDLINSIKTHAYEANKTDRNTINEKLGVA